MKNKDHYANRQDLTEEYKELLNRRINVSLAKEQRLRDVVFGISSPDTCVWLNDPQFKELLNNDFQFQSLIKELADIQKAIKNFPIEKRCIS